ncbi:MAG: DUF2029 domain-containing protein [Phycisphaerae bacterium]|nr:DUF2029 domain-containing protein [Phycisphaerae bacterium]
MTHDRSSDTAATRVEGSRAGRGPACESVAPASGSAVGGVAGRLDSLDQVRAVAFGGMVLAHFLPGVAERLPRWGPVWDAMTFASRFATPGFVTVFGLTAGFVFLDAARRGDTSRLGGRLLRRVLLLILCIGITHFGMFRTRVLAGDWRVSSWLTAFYCVLSFYALAVASLPVWVRVLARAPAYAAAAAGLVLWTVGAWLAFVAWRDEPADDLAAVIRLYTVSGDYAYLPLMGTALLAMPLGAAVRGAMRAGELDAMLRRVLTLGMVTAAVGVAYGELIGDMSYEGIVNSTVKDPARGWYYMLFGGCAAALVAGLGLIVPRVRRFALALYPLTLAGRCALPLYVAHIMVQPSLAVVDRLMAPSKIEGAGRVVLGLGLIGVLSMALLLRQHMKNPRPPAVTEGDRRMLARAGAAALLALGLGYAVYAGVAVASDSRGRNAHFFYAAGRCWLEGRSPYHFESFGAELGKTFPHPPQPFVYPPTISVLCVPLGLLPWEAARHVFDALSLGALVAVCVFSALLIGRAGPVRWTGPPLWAWTGAALLLLRPIVLCLNVSQMSLIALAGVLGALHFWSNGRWWVCGLLLVVASMKPQLSILVGAYMLVAGWRGVVPGVVLTGLVAGGTLVLSPLGTLRADLAESLTKHLELEFNRWPNYANLPSALGRLGDWGVRAGVASALLVVAWAAWRDRRVAAAAGDGRVVVPLATLLLTLAATGLCSPLHDYDLGLYLPLMAAFGVLGTSRWGWIAAMLPGLLLLARPGAFVAILGRLGMGGAPSSAVTTAGAALVFVAAGAMWLRGTRRDGPVVG